jgi:UDP-2,4-diacetamido-2,4,6-trideoxy-beta-L-altropyranose hydrolase
MKAAIRADAGYHIGTGHIVRCLTLAEMLKGQGVEVLFLCRAHSGNLIQYVQDSGFA